MSTGVPPCSEPDRAPAGPLSLTLQPVGEAPRPRADAVRNRARLLEAAARLAAEQGAANLTMEAVAAAAEVGKGTVFRRFGDRAGLLLALLDRGERQFQAAFLSGPPPVGPGAPVLQRLRAFGPAVLRHEQAHLDLYLAAEVGPDRRFLAAPRRLRLTHVTMLLRRAEVGADPELFAETLLAYLDTALVHHLISQRGMSLERLEEGWRELVARLVPGGGC